MSIGLDRTTIRESVQESSVGDETVEVALKGAYAAQPLNLCARIATPGSR